LLCSRLSAAASAAAFLLAELVYVGLHAKPLAPLLPGRGAGRADRAFLHTYTTAAYFSSELALLALLASVSPARAALPRAVAGVHAGFHVLYTALAWAAPRWCLQANVTRVECPAPPATLRGAWAWLLNALNAADLALHVAYAYALALLAWRSAHRLCV
ncbi:hypothetical protein WJX81_003630, partial [Elliptochloris bilobata]